LDQHTPKRLRLAATRLRITLRVWTFRVSCDGSHCKRAILEERTDNPAALSPRGTEHSYDFLVGRHGVTWRGGVRCGRRGGGVGNLGSTAI
jgi:hypothetical protein